jgi:hypothetical protein
MPRSNLPPAKTDRYCRTAFYEAAWLDNMSPATVKRIKATPEYELMTVLLRVANMGCPEYYTATGILLDALMAACHNVVTLMEPEDLEAWLSVHGEASPSDMTLTPSPSGSDPSPCAAREL